MAQAGCGVVSEQAKTNNNWCLELLTSRSRTTDFMRVFNETQPAMLSFLMNSQLKLLLLV